MSIVIQMMNLILKEKAYLPYESLGNLNELNNFYLH
jgi:hypothetical protein